MNLHQYIGKPDRLAALTDDKLEDLLTISWVNDKSFYGVFLREKQRRMNEKKPGINSPAGAANREEEICLPSK